MINKKLIEMLPRARTILSGIQPTGVPHLGNYLGAIRSWVALSKCGNEVDNRDQMLFSIVDLHALTAVATITPKQLNDSVPAHAQLSWIFSCMTSMGWLSRMTQWKSKYKSSGNPLDPASGMKLGLLSYPVLQAADILIYKATHVPAGEDQCQNLELARDIAKVFNTTYRVSMFPLPVSISEVSTKRIMSLRDPTVKMSKSDPQFASRIGLIDTPDEIVSKIRKSMTDAHTLVTYDQEARPGVANLLAIYASLSDSSPEAAAIELVGCDMYTLKTKVSEIVVNSLASIRAEYTRLQTDRGYVQSVLRAGRDQARNLSESNWRDIQQAIGITDVTEV